MKTSGAAFSNPLAIGFIFLFMFDSKKGAKKWLFSKGSV